MFRSGFLVGISFSCLPVFLKYFSPFFLNRVVVNKFLYLNKYDFLSRSNHKSLEKIYLQCNNNNNENQFPDCFITWWNFECCRTRNLAARIASRLVEERKGLCWELGLMDPHDRTDPTHAGRFPVSHLQSDPRASITHLTTEMSCSSDL